jgi:hypothetical protein
MNIMFIRSPMPALLVQLPAGHHRAYDRWRRRDRARRAHRTSFTDGECVTGSRAGRTSNSDLGLRLRLATLKSP